MGCATGMVKFIMFFFNFIFVVGGILMVTAGALALSEFENYKPIANLDEYRAPPIILIVVGCLVFFIAFMGCCGVLRENNCMMMTYAVFLTVILLVQIGIAVGAALYKDEFKEVLEKGMKKSINEYHKDAVKQSWDSIQSNLHCCGGMGYEDWRQHNEVPDSCCKTVERGCAKGAFENPSKIYTQGCVDKAFEQIRLKYVIYAAAIIAGIELLGIFFSCCLAARFRRKSYT